MARGSSGFCPSRSASLAGRGRRAPWASAGPGACRAGARTGRWLRRSSACSSSVRRTEVIDVVQRPAGVEKVPAGEAGAGRAPRPEAGLSGCAQSSAEALTARTGQEASSRMRWALEPRISLPTGVRRRRPMTMNSASDLLGDGDEVLGRARCRAPAGGPRGRRRPASSGPRSCVSSASNRTRLLGVEVLAATAGVDDDQPAVAQQRLLRSTAQSRSALSGRHVAHDDGHLNLLVHRLRLGTWPVRATLPDSGGGRGQVARRHTRGQGCAGPPPRVSGCAGG